MYSPSCQIDFYHLTQSDLGKNVAMLASKIVGSGQKALILCTKLNAESMSSSLWETQADTFLAHGIGDETVNVNAPLWLVHDPDSNPIMADHILVTGGLEVADAYHFKRLFLLFDGTSEMELAAARSKWKSWSKEEGIQCRYFAQDDAGKWTQKA